MADEDLITVTLTVTAKLKHIEGEEAHEAELKEELTSILESEFPANLTGFGEEGDGEYEVYDFDVTS